MKIITKIILVVSMVLPGYSFSQQVIQTQKQVVCTELQHLIRFLVQEFEEVPVFIGSGTNEDTKTFLAINPKTGTWTFGEHKDKLVCVLSSGTSMEFNTEIVRKLGI